MDNSLDAAARKPHPPALLESVGLGPDVAAPSPPRAPVASAPDAPHAWSDEALGAFLAGTPHSDHPPPLRPDRPPARLPSPARDPGPGGSRSPAIRDAVALETLRRLRSNRRPPAPPALRCSADAWAQLGPRLSRRTREEFFVVALDARNRLLSCRRAALGSLSTCLVHPREVFAPLLRRRAAAALLVHNHPSGDPDPSPEDETLTERLVAAGLLLGIPVLDHLIIARHGYVSLRDLGKMGDRRG
ncbi:MAG: JAB domain-containing protein [Deltaproteobacteria bacterium]|nr:JAB domain-containing protein [Deltaproteobacteria bacterium]